MSVVGLVELGELLELDELAAELRGSAAAREDAQAPVDRRRRRWTPRVGETVQLST